MLVALHFAVAYPQNYLTKNARFPPSKSLGPMSPNGEGTFNADIVSSTGIQCSFSAGVYAVGTFTSHSFPFTREVDGELRVASLNTPSQAFHPATGTYTVMCAENGPRWEYASWDGAAFDPYADADAETHSVIVVGDGIGALAAARAMHEVAPTLDLISIGPGTSTTSRSTGVAWFPNKTVHNTTHLFASSTGSDTANRTFVDSWIQNSSPAFKFWDALLDFAPFKYPFMTPQSPYEYSGLPGNNAFAPTFCFNTTTHTVMNTCGSLLVEFLKQPLDHRTAYVTSIRRDVSGDFLLRTTEQNYKARVLVLGTGGTAWNQSSYSPYIHADNRNTGIATTVATTFDLEPVSNDNCYYLPHVKLPQTDLMAEWFPVTNCEPCNASICDPYNKRGYEMTSCTGTAADISTCSASAQWWRALLNSSIFPLLSTPCNVTQFHKGVIDCKGGFKVDLDFSSPTIPRLYASGTTAASFTGNTYFAPGATIGLGFYSGYQIALTAPSRVTRDAPPEMSFPLASLLFTLAAVGFIEGIAIHALADTNAMKSIFSALQRCIPSPYVNPYFVHGLDMVISFLLLTAAIGVAISKREASMNKSHTTVGYVAYFLFLLQILFGLVLHNSEQSPFNRKAHRAHALFVLVPLLVYLYISGTLRTIEVYDWHEASWITFTAVTALVWIISVRNILHYKSVAPNALFELFFVA